MRFYTNAEELNCPPCLPKELFEVVKEFHLRYQTLIYLYKANMKVKSLVKNHVIFDIVPTPKSLFVQPIGSLTTLPVPFPLIIYIYFLAGARILRSSAVLPEGYYDSHIGPQRVQS